MIWHVNCLRPGLQRKALNLKAMLSAEGLGGLQSHAECPEPLLQNMALAF